LLLRIRLILRVRLRSGAAIAVASATAPAPVATARPLTLSVRGLGGRRRWRRALAALLRRLRALRTVLAAIAIPITPALRLLAGGWAPFRTRRTAARTALLAPGAGALLELLNFALHELATLRLQLVASRVMAAVGTALPPLGIGLLAGRTGDALG